MALEVIGTGFGRTGTESMQYALEILGFGTRRDQWGQTLLKRNIMSDQLSLTLFFGIA